MNNLTRSTVGILAAGLVSLAGAAPAVAQTDIARLDMDAVARELALSDEAARELAPLLDQLNAVLETRREHWQEGDEIQQQFLDTYDQIAERLTVTQERDFHWLLRNAVTAPLAGRSMRRYLNCGRVGSLPYGGRGLMRGRGFGRGGAPMRGTAGRGGVRTPVRELPDNPAWNRRPAWRPGRWQPDTTR